MITDSTKLAEEIRNAERTALLIYTIEDSLDFSLLVITEIIDVILLVFINLLFLSSTFTRFMAVSVTEPERS